MLQILQTFDRSIDDISIVGEDVYLHNTDSGSMPLFAYGSGLQKAVLLTVAIAYCKNGVILVDEIDNAIHVTAFKDVFGWFLDACIRWDEDLLVIVKILLTKLSVWSYENEWRMISMLPDNALFCRIYSLKPTSVYIGVRPDEEAANTLYQICCEKDVPCYKMVPAYLSGSFSIRPVEYEVHIEVTNRLKQKNML